MKLTILFVLVATFYVVTIVETKGDFDKPYMINYLKRFFEKGLIEGITVDDLKDKSMDELVFLGLQGVAAEKQASSPNGKKGWLF